MERVSKSHPTGAEAGIFLHHLLLVTGLGLPPCELPPQPSDLSHLWAESISFAYSKKASGYMGTASAKETRAGH